MSNLCSARIWDRTKCDINKRCRNKICENNLCKIHIRLSSYQNIDKPPNGFWGGYIDNEVIYKYKDILIIAWENNDVKMKIVEDINNGLINKYQNRYYKNKRKVGNIFNKSGNIKIEIQKYLGDYSKLIINNPINDKSFNLNKNKNPINNIMIHKNNDIINNNGMDICKNKIFYILDEDETLQIKIERNDQEINKVYISCDEGDSYEIYGIYYYSQKHGSDIIENKISGGIRYFQEIYAYHNNDKLYKLIHKERI